MTASSDKPGTRPAAQSPPLCAVDQVEIISLQDNYVEMLCTQDRDDVESALDWVTTEPDGKSPFTCAEHGFAMWIRTTVDGVSHTVIFDTGASETGAIQNAQIMKLDLSQIEAVVLSHSHFDHSGGLLALLAELSKTDLPLVLHADMFKTRGIEKDGHIRRLQTFPDAQKLSSLGARVITTAEPQLLADDTVLVMGEVPRASDFEQGFTPGRVMTDDHWEPDPWMWDDRGIVIKVRGKGLVVVSGCAHSGIVNNLHHARNLTGNADPIYAVMGGFHLAGRPFEARIEPTVAEIKKMGPAMVVPSHCTGWKGIHAIARELPDAFVHPSTGNRYLIKAP